MERLTLALIAHDGKKDEMVKLAREHKENLAKLALVATRSTGQLVRLESPRPFRRTRSVESPSPS